MEVKPFSESSDSRKQQVKVMFDKIAGRYDFLNHLLSFNKDKKWRKILIKKVLQETNTQNYEAIKILDVATGTGDLAIALSKIDSCSVTGLDLSEEMLEKAKSKSINKDIKWIVGDSEALPFNGHSFHFVTAAFGVRNFENLEQGIGEMVRVLKPSGKLFILEFSQPGSNIFGVLYSFYSKRILPLLASIFSKEPRAYTYLPKSIEVFPSGEDMCNILKSCGLSNVQYQRLSGGITSIYVGSK